MSQQIIKKRSGYAVAATVFAACFWFFWLAVLLFSSLLYYGAQNWKCERQDFGGCALQNLFGGLFLFIAAVVIFLVFPLILIGISILLGFIGIFQKDRDTTLARIMLIHDLAAIPATILFCLALLGYLSN